MTTAWSDAGDDLNQRPSRPARTRYIPPHYRNNGVSGFNNASEPAQSGYASFNRFESGKLGRSGGSNNGGRGRFGGRGRGGGSRGRRHSRPEDVFESSPYSSRDEFDIAEKFDDFRLTEEDGNGEGINFDAYEDIPVEASGSDIPPPVNTFDEIDLDEHLNTNIKRCNYVKPTPIQRHAIPIAVAGRDLMACAQTGSGKTAAFCFPIISGILKDLFRFYTTQGGRTAYPYALILSPTRELSCQIHDEAKKFAYQTGVRIAVAYGGASITQQLRNFERGVDILVATPGRLVDMIERERVSLTKIKYLALDEADRMLDMGFEPQIRKIVQQMDMPAPGVRQTMLFSATFPHDIQRLASDFLSNYIFLTVGRVGSSTELIVQKVEHVQDIEKRNFLTDILCRQRENGARGKQALTLVFVETKRGADALENWLSRKGFPAIAIHGDKVQMERERALRSFKSGATPILVATDVASRGLDIPHVAHVINFDLPKDIDDYVHRIGRTGRAGKSGLATAFFSDKNMPLAKSLVILMKEANQEVPTWLSQYAESSSSSGSSSRTHRFGSGKYGGHDFRKVTEPGIENYNYFTAYGNADQSVDTTYTDASYDFTNSCSDSFYSIQQSVPAGSYYYPAANAVYGVGDAQVGQYGYTSVVATGWD